MLNKENVILAAFRRIVRQQGWTAESAPFHSGGILKPPASGWGVLKRLTRPPEGPAAPFLRTRLARPPCYGQFRSPQWDAEADCMACKFDAACRKMFNERKENTK